jgi:hypothetical protein
MQQSPEALKNDPALSEPDFVIFVKAFAFHPDQGKFLLQTNAHNEKLAETLLVFRKKLSESMAQRLDLDPIIQQMFLHYIINTNGPINESADSDAFDVFEAASRYAGLLSVSVSKDGEGNAILRIDDKDVLCSQWKMEPGVSAARSLRSIGPIINRARYGRDDVIPSYAFGFDEIAPMHTLENAMTLADFAHLAYFTPTYVEKQSKAWGYNSFTWIESIDADTQAFFDETYDYHV